jgi:hypothetical protein
VNADDYVPLSDEDEQVLTGLINAGVSMREAVEFWREAKDRAVRRRIEA